MHPDAQERLRQELLQFSSELTYNELWSTSVAPYLDAVVKETLRLHAPVTEGLKSVSSFTRVA
jgi:cytochrome P450